MITGLDLLAGIHGALGWGPFSATSYLKGKGEFCVLGRMYSMGLASHALNLRCFPIYTLLYLPLLSRYDWNFTF